MIKDIQIIDKDKNILYDYKTYIYMQNSYIIINNKRRHMRTSVFYNITKYKNQNIENQKIKMNTL